MVTALGITTFGGIAQIIFTWIIAASGEKLSFVWYVVAMDAVTVAPLLLVVRHLDRTREVACQAGPAPSNVFGSK